MCGVRVLVREIDSSIYRRWVIKGHFPLLLMGGNKRGFKLELVGTVLLAEGLDDGDGDAFFLEAQLNFCAWGGVRAGEDGAEVESASDEASSEVASTTVAGAGMSMPSNT